MVPFFAQTTSVDTGSLLIPAIIAVVLAIILIVAWWRVFEKAGKPGILAIIPIVNILMLFDIAGKPMWWFLLLLIPIVNFIIIILLWLALAERFGKGVGFGIGLWLLNPIFMLLLAFGDAEYVSA